MAMKLTVLGCGTSTGVPVPGCQCEICTSPNPKNNRTRTSVSLTSPGGTTVIVDTTTDFRQQILRENIRRVDAVLYTHSHADHILGLDDLRGFNFSQKEPIHCYGSQKTLDEIKRFFWYIFNPDPNYQGGALTQLVMNPIDEKSPFQIGDITVQPFKLDHGRSPVTGYRFGSFAYATDCSHIPEESCEILQGIEYLILDGLRFDPPHKTHFTIPQAVAVVEKLGNPRTYLTHMTHTVEYDQAVRNLPEHVSPAYDGLVIEF